MSRRPYMFESPRLRRRRALRASLAAIATCVIVSGAIAWAIVEGLTK